MRKVNIMNKSAIIVGASSGIGKALSLELSQAGYTLGLCARRLTLLNEIKKSISSNTYIQQMDVTDKAQVEKGILSLIDQMGRVDLVVICAGTGHINPDLDTGLSLDTVNTNVSGFTTIANSAFRYFQNSGAGHLAAITSVAALRGSADAPSYNASKAYMSNYLDGLRLKASKNNLDITVTEIRPGFVDTDMAKGEGLFWVSSPQKAAAQIFKAIKDKKSYAYVTKRWRLVAWILRILPDMLYKKIS